MNQQISYPRPRALPSIISLMQYEPQKSWFVSEDRAKNTVHGIGHLARVLVLQEILTRLLVESGTSPQGLNQEAIRWAAVTHDVKRISDFRSYNHGTVAAEWVATILPNTLTQKTITKIKEILKSHENFETILSEDNYENAILSDADKLERCRLENILPTYTPEIIKRKIGLDPRRFNFPLSKNLISLAQALQKSSQFEQKTYTIQPFYCVMLTAKQLGILT